MAVIAQIPKGQSIRFATRFETNTMDDLLGYEDNFTNSIMALRKDAFIHEFSKNQVVKYQILASDYDNITTNLYLNGVLQTYTPDQLHSTQLTNNMNVAASEDVTLYEGDTGKTKIYFDGELPVWATVGQSITIADGANDGTYSIESLTYDEDLDGFVAIYANTYASGGSGATCSTTYNIKDYEIHEITIDWSEFSISGENVECYQIEHAFTDSVYDSITYLSEPLRHAATDSDNILKITWNGSGTEFLVDYDYGQVNELHLVGDLFEIEPAGESSTYTDDDQKLTVLEGVYIRRLKMLIERLPRAICEQLTIATKHTSFYVNGVEFATEENPNIERVEGNVLNNFEVTLQQVELTGVNVL